LDHPLHVILNKSKLAYRIYVILIANKDLKKKKVTSVRHPNTRNKRCTPPNFCKNFLKGGSEVDLSSIVTVIISLVASLRPGEGAESSGVRFCRQVSPQSPCEASR
jgi:hypothetical protein